VAPLPLPVKNKPAVVLLVDLFSRLTRMEWNDVIRFHSPFARCAFAVRTVRTKEIATPYQIIITEIIITSSSF
jgi:hypothetical protein